MDHFSETFSSRLRIIYESGNQERLRDEARRVLESDPENPEAHYYLASALLDLEAFSEAKIHIDFLLADDPEALSSQMLAIGYFFKREKWKLMNKHVKEALRLAPEDASVYYYAAICEAQLLRLSAAKAYVQKARELDPDDPDIANLAFRMSLIENDSKREGWRQVEAYENALMHDAENATLHEGLGDVYLDSLDMPKEAERHYRESLRIDPRNRPCQKELFKAVAKQRFLYRLVSIPSRSMGWLRLLLTAIRLQPWRALFLLLAVKFFMLFLLWLVVVTAIFWPAGKIYEWLLVSEIKAGSQASVGQWRRWQWFQQLPIAVRMGLFFLLLCLIWYGGFLALSIPVQKGFIFVGIFAAVHFVVILLGFGIRRLATVLERWRLRRKGGTL